MAFHPKDLSSLARADSFVLWHYATTDTVAEVTSDNYFEKVGGLLNVGDIIIANVETASTPKAGLFLVTKSVKGNVSITDMTQTVSTDAR